MHVPFIVTNCFRAVPAAVIWHAIATTVNAEVLYVDLQSKGMLHDGSSWCNAFIHLQDALAAAEVSNGGVTEIRVAIGTHRPDRGANQVVGDRSASFRIIDGVSLIGSFGGCAAADPEARLLNVAGTWLVGDLDANDAPDFVNRSDNVYHVAFADGVGAGTVIDGFLIRGGFADGVTFPDADGAGMYIRNGAPTLCNVQFFDNLARSNGGGLYVVGSDAYLDDCWFSGNRADANGGGLFSAGNVTVDSGLFLGNSAGDNGGGIYVNTQSQANFLFPRIFNCHTDGSGGGLATGIGGAVSIVGGIIGRNTARCGGGLQLDGNAMVSNSYIALNESVEEGGGISVNAFEAFDQRVESSTLFGNSAGTDGGGVFYFNFASPLQIDNSILWGNAANGLQTDVAQVDGVIGAVNMNYNCVEGWTGSLGGSGNIGSDPGFVDGTYDPDSGDTTLNVALGFDSPCIDAGDPSVGFAPGLLDVAGRPRVMCGRVDMGGLEFGFGDFNCDRVVELADFEHWPQCATGPQSTGYSVGCEAFDHNGDQGIALDDFAAFQSLPR